MTGLDWTGLDWTKVTKGVTGMTDLPTGWTKCLTD